jgi:NAD(P)-dependent dehydrogenase (short-subunit alcohol dehydrogenase family)
VATGGNTGLGHAIVLGLDEAGADVVASSRRLEQEVNAAGITHKAHVLELDEAGWRRVMETSLTGTLRACRIFGCPYPGG